MKANQVEKKILVIVVTFNGEGDIRQCLDSLLKSEHQVTLYVIDNASDDKTLEIIQTEYPSIILIKNEKNIGFGQANNLGFDFAVKNNFDYVFMLNQDAYIENDTIEKLVQAQLQNPEYDLLSPMHFDRSKNHLDARFYLYIKGGCQEYLMELITSNKRKLVYPSLFINAAAWLLTVKCIRIVGKFDPIFFHTGEDIDYYNRIKFHKMNTGIVPASKIYHLRSNNGKLPAFESFYFHRFVHLMVHLKNPLIKTSLRKIQRDLLLECFCCILKGEFRDGKEILRIFAKLCIKKV